VRRGKEAEAEEAEEAEEMKGTEVRRVETRKNGKR